MERRITVTVATFPFLNYGDSCNILFFIIPFFISLKKGNVATVTVILITIVVLVGLLLVVKRLPSHEPRPGFVKWRNRFFILVGVCLLMIVVREKYEMHVDRDNPVNLPIVAEKYVWPVGCEERNYVKGDPISSNCMSKKYYMRSGLKYKFNGYIEYVNKTPNYYYRVQNDAFSINCFFSGCFISIVHKNVFKVNTDA